MRCSQEELEALIRTAASTTSSNDLAEQSGWSQTAVYRTAKRLGYKFPRGKPAPWSDQERTLAQTLKAQGKHAAEVADALGRSFSSVRSYFIYLADKQRKAVRDETPTPTPEELMAEHKAWLAKVRAQQRWRQQQHAMSVRL